MAKKGGNKDEYFTIIKKCLEGYDTVDSDLIRSQCDEFKNRLHSILPLTDIEFEELVAELEGFHSIRKAEVSVVQGEKLNIGFGNFAFPRWDRYQKWKTYISQFQLQICTIKQS